MPDPARDPKYPRVYTWARTVNVSTSYFRTMRIPLKQGREFDKFDNEQSMLVAIINETAARRYWSGKDPIGKRLGATLGKRRPGLPESRKPPVTIVGIVGDSMQNALEKQPLPTIYRPLLQSTRRKVDYKLSEAVLREVDHIGLVIRTSGRPEDLLNAAEKQVRNLDPEQPPLRI
ncbi:MAG: ABC transporter permease, partial [Blastocatellia bacterium]|nr:ABC transporter permease [Blastocatellia bacterium]